MNNVHPIHTAPSYETHQPELHGGHITLPADQVTHLADLLTQAAKHGAITIEAHQLAISYLKVAASRHIHPSMKGKR